MFMKDSDVIGANSGSACGFSDWKVNVAKDVSSVVGPSGCPTSDAIGTVYKTVILMIGSNLWMGDNDNGSTDSDNFIQELKILVLIKNNLIYLNTLK